MLTVFMQHDTDEPINDLCDDALSTTSEVSLLDSNVSSVSDKKPLAVVSNPDLAQSPGFSETTKRQGCEAQITYKKPSGRDGVQIPPQFPLHVNSIVKSESIGTISASEQSREITTQQVHHAITTTAATMNLRQLQNDMVDVEDRKS